MRNALFYAAGIITEGSQKSVPVLGNGVAWQGTLYILSRCSPATGKVHGVKAIYFIFEREMSLASGFQPLRYYDGFLPIQDHALIGDGATAALVGRDGSIPWMCLPRFDSPPVFAALLDHKQGGRFSVYPEGVTESHQYYERDTAVLVTELRCATGMVRITDACILRGGVRLSEDMPAGRNELARFVEVIQGTVRLHVHFEPHGEYDVRNRGGGLYFALRDRPELDLQLWSNHALPGARTSHDLSAGDTLELVLSWSRFKHRIRPASTRVLLEQTRQRWRQWLEAFTYDGPQYDLVRRSAITLKLLDYFENGALIAAPTASLPEAVGGVRNWDYRYTWIRDAAFSVYAMGHIGMKNEAEDFLAWVLDVAEHQERPDVMYTVCGGPVPTEWEVPGLRGYRHSGPVRFGNGAADQMQHDVFGEILDCAFQWARHGEVLDEWLWRRMHSFVEGARASWDTPDQGIWEVRSPGRVFTYSAGMCQVALDRGAFLAERFSLPGDVAGWRRDASMIRDAILEEAWNPEVNAITQQFGGKQLDASILSLPLRKVLRADHPRMVATTNAIMRRLDAGKGLLYRYLPEEAPDGLPGDEGAFLLCSFWLVDNLAEQGRVEEASDLYDSLCARANHVGLLSEEVDPVSGDFLGNFPQAFSHVGVIASGYKLGRILKRLERV